ncbi:MAG TPA: hypothetical protein VFD92_18070 [Candidatus Binatia bacterium]|nr:hypothetical protein [Candidatus Binatia bacterium]
MTDEASTELLREIRDGIGATNLRLAAVDQHLELRLASIDERLESLHHRLLAIHDRLARAEEPAVELARALRRIGVDQARHERFHTRHVDVLERDLDELKDRVRRLEEKLSDP